MSENNPETSEKNQEDISPDAERSIQENFLHSSPSKLPIPSSFSSIQSNQVQTAKDNDNNNSLGDSVKQEELALVHLQESQDDPNDSIDKFQVNLFEPVTVYSDKQQLLPTQQERQGSSSISPSDFIKNSQSEQQNSVGEQTDTQQHNAVQLVNDTFGGGSPSVHSSHPNRFSEEFQENRCLQDRKGTKDTPIIQANNFQASDANLTNHKENNQVLLLLSNSHASITSDRVSQKSPSFALNADSFVAMSDKNGNLDHNDLVIELSKGGQDQQNLFQNGSTKATNQESIQRRRPTAAFAQDTSKVHQSDRLQPDLLIEEEQLPLRELLSENPFSQNHGQMFAEDQSQKIRESLLENSPDFIHKKDIQINSNSVQQINDICAQNENIEVESIQNEQVSENESENHSCEDEELVISEALPPNKPTNFHNDLLQPLDPYLQQKARNFSLRQPFDQNQNNLQPSTSVELPRRKYYHTRDSHRSAIDDQEADYMTSEKKSADPFLQPVYGECEKFDKNMNMPLQRNSSPAKNNQQFQTDQKKDSNQQNNIPNDNNIFNVSPSSTAYNQSMYQTPELNPTLNESMRQTNQTQIPFPNMTGTPSGQGLLQAAQSSSTNKKEPQITNRQIQENSELKLAINSYELMQQREADQIQIEDSGEVLDTGRFNNQNENEQENQSSSDLEENVPESSCEEDGEESVEIESLEKQNDTTLNKQQQSKEVVNQRYLFVENNQHRNPFDQVGRTSSLEKEQKDYDMPLQMANGPLLSQNSLQQDKSHQNRQTFGSNSKHKQTQDTAALQEKLQQNHEQSKKQLLLDIVQEEENQKDWQPKVLGDTETEINCDFDFSQVDTEVRKSTHTGVVFDDDDDEKEPGSRISPIKESLSARKLLKNNGEQSSISQKNRKQLILSGEDHQKSPQLLQQAQEKIQQNSESTQKKKFEHTFGDGIIPVLCDSENTNEYQNQGAQYGDTKNANQNHEVHVADKDKQTEIISETNQGDTKNGLQDNSNEKITKDCGVKNAKISLSTDSIFNMNEEDAAFLEGIDQLAPQNDGVLQILDKEKQQKQGSVSFTQSAESTQIMDFITSLESLWTDIIMGRIQGAVMQSQGQKKVAQILQLPHDISSHLTTQITQISVFYQLNKDKTTFRLPTKKVSILAQLAKQIVVQDHISIPRQTRSQFTLIVLEMLKECQERVNQRKETKLKELDPKNSCSSPDTDCQVVLSIADSKQSKSIGNQNAQINDFLSATSSFSTTQVDLASELQTQADIFKQKQGKEQNLVGKKKAIGRNKVVLMESVGDSLLKNQAQPSLKQSKILKRAQSHKKFISDTTGGAISSQILKQKKNQLGIGPAAVRKLDRVKSKQDFSGISSKALLPNLIEQKLEHEISRRIVANKKKSQMQKQAKILSQIDMQSSVASKVSIMRKQTKNTESQSSLQETDSMLLKHDLISQMKILRKGISKKSASEMGTMLSRGATPSGISSNFNLSQGSKTDFSHLTSLKTLNTAESQKKGGFGEEIIKPSKVVTADIFKPFSSEDLGRPDEAAVGVFSASLSQSAETNSLCSRQSFGRGITHQSMDGARFKVAKRGVAVKSLMKSKKTGVKKVAKKVQQQPLTSFGVNNQSFADLQTQNNMSQSSSKNGLMQDIFGNVAVNQTAVSNQSKLHNFRQSDRQQQQLTEEQRKKAPIRSNQYTGLGLLKGQNLQKKHKKLTQEGGQECIQGKRLEHAQVLKTNSSAIPYRVTRNAQPTQHKQYQILDQKGSLEGQKNGIVEENEPEDDDTWF